MPIWVTDLLRWLGLAKDSTRPNTGALLGLVGLSLLAAGYQPDDLMGFAEKAELMAHKLLEFSTKADNVLGGAALALGWKMSRGGAPAAP